MEGRQRNPYSILCNVRRTSREPLLRCMYSTFLQQKKKSFLKLYFRTRNAGIASLFGWTLGSVIPVCHDMHNTA